jgi:prepilin-type N-terminal cleavage/methylation domain-containing protein
MKLKAFSLLEVMVAILLSGIVISAIYSGYLFTHKQFFRFNAIKTEIRNYFELSEVLNREFETAKKIIKTGSQEIEIEMIDKTVSYSFNTNYILRTIENQVDTFFVGVTNAEINVINELVDEAIVDFTELSIKENEQEKMLSLYKNYGAIVKIEE